MNDIDELKQFVQVHARTQGIAPAQYSEMLGRIRTDDEGMPGSWAVEWSRSARALAEQGRHLDAVRYYNLARFPYVDGPARQEALTNCVGAFEQWAADFPFIERRELKLPGGRVRCWTSGLSAARPLPVLLICGGIVSIKEQWAQVLGAVRRLGMAAVVVEMPSVGENSLPYTADSWQLLSGVLDELAHVADVTRTYAIALSFSGHLALRCAVNDPRIKGVVTAGPPVRDFFTDTDWQAGVPRVTVETLAHLTGTKPAETLGQLRDWALSVDELEALDIPVHCMASARDEIIPPGDVELLRRHVKGVHLVTNDDVHGSPAHAAEARLWTVLSVLRMRQAGGMQRAVIGALFQATRVRRRLAGTPA
ncbi:alpha/beta hydrolase [Streptomyces sp. NRRL F-525]|uniref:alpha/beta hydrolase n=1 Tax=Streptomyces sp. NRRL F-525 TaxID=1463861 RepID=UPI000524A8B1|nr:alpha/beta hydrolase [Streptomyces sp. NRRL F-525]